jgi:hypothetical protein
MRMEFCSDNVFDSSQWEDGRRDGKIGGCVRETSCKDLRLMELAKDRI